MDKGEITERVTKLYPDAIFDIQGSDCNFELYIVSQGFEGKRILQRQQSILALFAEELASGKLHALGLKLKTPAEQESLNDASLIQLS